MASNQDSANKHNSPNTHGSLNPDKGTKPSSEKRPHDDRADSDRDFDDPVNEASDESFPASDPPSWTNSTATKDGR